MSSAIRACFHQRNMEHHPVVYLRNLQNHGNPWTARSFHRSRLEKLESLYHLNLRAHYGCVNALEFSTKGGNLLASGGDDKRVLLWNLESAISNPKYRPLMMHATHLSNIYCLAFNRTDDKLVSSGNDAQVILHDLHTNNLIDVFLCDNAVYGLSACPSNDNLVAAACEDGTVYIMDTRLTKADSTCLARRSSAFHSVMFSPVDHHLIATSHSKDGMALWDIRSPKKEVLHYGLRGTKQRGMSARFNKTGNQLLCLRRCQRFALYNINDSKSIAEFECEGYSNSCTMKSCCFAGDKDQYVVSGSDDFGVYMWKIPEDYEEKPVIVNNAFKILRSHRSIVNQVRFDRHSNFLVSCGVEKMVKLWSTEKLPAGISQSALKMEPPRKRYSHNEYIQLILESSEMVHDYRSENTEEDPKMLAFFDSLIQHEAEDRSSSESDCTEEVETTVMRERMHSLLDAYYNEIGGGSDHGSTSERPSSDANDSEGGNHGPASLETLGITNARTGLSEETQQKLKTLRARVNSDDNWQCSGSSSTKPAKHKDDLNVPDKESGKTAHKAKKRRKAVVTSTYSSSDDNSASEADSARTRQKNARRRLRKLFKKDNVSEEEKPGTSGLYSNASPSSDKSTPADPSS